MARPGRFGRDCIASASYLRQNFSRLEVAPGEGTGDCAAGKLPLGKGKLAPFLAQLDLAPRLGGMGGQLFKGVLAWKPAVSPCLPRKVIRPAKKSRLRFRAARAQVGECQWAAGAQSG